MTLLQIIQSITELSDGTPNDNLFWSDMFCYSEKKKLEEANLGEQL